MHYRGHRAPPSKRGLTKRTAHVMTTNITRFNQLAARVPTAGAMNKVRTGAEDEGQRKQSRNNLSRRGPLAP
jgi:hypothetical protein